MQGWEGKSSGTTGVLTPGAGNTGQACRPKTAELALCLYQLTAGSQIGEPTHTQGRGDHWANLQTSRQRVNTTEGWKFEQQTKPHAAGKYITAVSHARTLCIKGTR